MNSHVPRLLLAAVLLLSLQGVLVSQSSEPMWLRLEQGKESFDRGEFGSALRIFRSVLEDDQTSPEAHYWVGRVFEEEGELDLAEKEYRLALDYKRQLYILKQETSIRERLARLYKIQGEYAKFEQALQDILETDPELGSPEEVVVQEAMVRTLNSMGLEKVVELYRIDKPDMYLAQAELGLFYYRTGRYMDAVRHLLNAGLTVITRTINYVDRNMPFDEFNNLNELFDLAAENAETRDYVRSTRLSALLYYLGASLYAAGDIEPYREVMRLVRDAFPGTPWRSRAISQLAEPYIEPVITSEEFFDFF